MVLGLDEDGQCASHGNHLRRRLEAEKLPGVNVGFSPRSGLHFSGCGKVIRCIQVSLPRWL